MTDSDSPGARPIQLDAKRGEPDSVYRVLPKSMSEVWNDVWDRWSDNFQIIVFIKKKEEKLADGVSPIAQIRLVQDRGYR